jgi:hypothetical protein
MILKEIVMNKIPKLRNSIARAAILRKGGVHEKSRSAKRQNSKRKLRQEVNSYMVTQYSDHFYDRINKMSLCNGFRMEIRPFA